MSVFFGNRNSEQAVNPGTFIVEDERKTVLKTLIVKPGIAFVLVEGEDGLFAVVENPNDVDACLEAAAQANAHEKFARQDAERFAAQHKGTVVLFNSGRVLENLVDLPENEGAEQFIVNAIQEGER